MAREKQLDDLRADLLRAFADLKESVTNQIKDSREDMKELRGKVNETLIDVARLETTLVTYKNIGSIILGLIIILEFILKYVIK